MGAVSSTGRGSAALGAASGLADRPYTWNGGVTAFCFAVTD